MSKVRSARADGRSSAFATVSRSNAHVTRGGRTLSLLKSRSAVSEADSSPRRTAGDRGIVLERALSELVCIGLSRDDGIVACSCEWLLSCQLQLAQVLTSRITLRACRVRKTGHAARAYSCSTPPRRSRRRTRTSPHSF